MVAAVASGSQRLRRPAPFFVRSEPPLAHAHKDEANARPVVPRPPVSPPHTWNWNWALDEV